MSHNTWIHKFSRHLASPLVNTAITPNHITTMRLLSGVAAAGFFALDNYYWGLCGVFFFLLSMVLDRMDGELARLSGKSSQFGSYYDLSTDAVCNALTFVALGVAATDSFLGTWAIVIGLIAGLSIAVIFTAVMLTEIKLGHGGATLNSWHGFDPDDAIVFVPIGMLFDLGDILLISAGFCTPLVAVILVYVMYQRRV